MASDAKKIERIIELSLGFKNKGPDAAKMFAAMNAELDRFKRANPSAQLAQITNHMYEYGKALDRLNKGFSASIKDQEKMGGAMKKVAEGLKLIQSAASGVINPLNTLAGLIGADGIGLGKGISWVVSYNKQIMGLTAQMSKYGIGITKVEKTLDEMRKKTGLTKKESGELFSLYEKGFPYNSLDRGVKLFENIKKAVGGNAEAMKEMTGFLQGMIDKFPELEDAITNLNNGGNKKLLESQSRLAYMTGQISLAEHKRFQDYIKQGRQVATADDVRKKQVEDEIDAINRLRATFEEISEMIGKTLIPYVKQFADWVKSISPIIMPWVPTITKIVAGFTAMVMAARTLSTVMKGVSLLSGGKNGWITQGAKWAMSNPGAAGRNLVRGGLGGAAGYGVGKLWDAGYEGLTGKELNKDGASDGTQGRAFVGQAGKAASMIGAGAAVGGVPGAIAAGIVYDVQGAIEIYNVSKDIVKTWGDIAVANAKISAGWDKIVSNAEEKHKAAMISGDQKEITRTGRTIEIENKRREANKLQEEGTGTFWNDDAMLAKAKELRQQANALQMQNNKERAEEEKAKAKANPVAKSDIKETIVKSIEAAKDNSGVIDSAASAIADKISKGDLAGGLRDQKSMMNLLDQTTATGTLSGASGDVKAVLQEKGISSDQLNSSNFKMSDKIWDQLSSAKNANESEMTGLKNKGELNEDEKKRMSTLQQANATINSQLEERYKIQDKFSPQLQIIDAAFNEHSKSVEATNKLLNSQKSLLSSMVANAQVTGNFDMNKISGQTNAAFASLKQYNEGLKQQIALEQQQLALANEALDEQQKSNANEITSLGGKSDEASQKRVKELTLENKQFDIRRSKNVLEQQANAKINEQLEQTETLQKQIVEILQSRLELNKANVEYAAANVSKAEALIDIYDNLGAGLKASAEMRMEAANLMGKQIGEEKKNLALIDQAISDGLPAMADAVGQEKEFQGKPREEIVAEANKRLITLQTQRVQKETQILGLVSKQAQMTKALRDGYVSAIMAMTAGSGMFNKILVTQDKNMGMGVKYMNVLQSKSSGGIGGGKKEAGQFTLGGLQDNDQTSGFKTWDGRWSNNNDVSDIQKNALNYTQERIRDQKSGASGAMGAPNVTGAVLGNAATTGQNGAIIPPGSNVNSPQVNIKPADKQTVIPESKPQSDRTGGNPSNTTINYGGIHVNVTDLNKFITAAKEKVDQAMNEVAKQIGGRSSSLPRGNA